MEFRLFTVISSILCLTSQISCYFLNEDRNTLGFNVESSIGDVQPYYRNDRNLHKTYMSGPSIKFQGQDRDKIVDSHFSILKSLPNSLLQGNPNQWGPPYRKRESVLETKKADRIIEGPRQTIAREPSTKLTKQVTTKAPEPQVTQVSNVKGETSQNLQKLFVAKGYNSVKTLQNIHINTNHVVDRGIGIGQGNKGKMNRSPDSQISLKHNYQALIVRPPTVPYPHFKAAAKTSDDSIKSKKDSKNLNLKDRRNILKTARFLEDGMDHKMIYRGSRGYRY